MSVPYNQIHSTLIRETCAELPFDEAWAWYMENASCERRYFSTDEGYARYIELTKKAIRLVSNA
jgi:hypothetical protein